MLSLATAKLQHVYKVVKVETDNEVAKHLQDLGLVSGAKITVVNNVGHDSVILLRSSRIGIDQAILEKIFVEEPDEVKTTWLSLDGLKVGETANVVNVHGTGAVRRRLLDMGLTRGTNLAVVKLAPFGDPVEIRVRGYELTLRKDEAALVLVEKELEE